MPRRRWNEDRRGNHRRQNRDWRRDLLTSGAHGLGRDRVGVEPVQDVDPLSESVPEVCVSDVFDEVPLQVRQPRDSTNRSFGVHTRGKSLAAADPRILDSRLNVARLNEVSVRDRVGSSRARRRSRVA